MAHGYGGDVAGRSSVHADAYSPSSGAPFAALTPAQPAAEYRGSGATPRERLVVLSIGLVSMAIAAMLYVQFFVSAGLSALVGAVACALFLLMNDKARKSAEISRLSAELARQKSTRVVGIDSSTPAGRPLAPDLAQNSDPNSLPNPLPDKSSANVSAAVDRAVANRRQDQLAASDPSSYGPSEMARWEPVSPAGSEASRARPRPEAAPTAAPSNPRGRAAAPLATTSAAPTSGQHVVRDQWAFRPRDNGQAAHPDFQRAMHDAGAPVTLPPRPAGSTFGDVPFEPMPIATIETDLALVQRKIKALADEVNGADVARPFEPPMPSPGAMVPGSDRRGPAANTDLAIEDSIGALKSAAATMRAGPAISQSMEPSSQAASPFGELMIPATAERIAASAPAYPPGLGSAPALSLHPETASHEPPSRSDAANLPPYPPMSQAAMPYAMTTPDLDLDLALTLPSLTALQPEPPPVDPKIKAMTRAIEAGRMDVMLSPIVGLMTNDVTHYDVKVRLQADAGGYFDHPEQDLLLAGSDVLALFDTARLTRAAALARRLDARGKTGSLLSEVTGPSLTNGGFLESFARIYEDRDRIAGQLVLTFTQGDTERFSPSAWQALSDMHAFGFRFALDRLEHLNIDFVALAQRGFAFVKLDASVLLSGMPSAQRFVPSQDVCRQIAGAGLTLIADAVNDDAMRARLFGFGVLFGQGQLFGGARMVSVDPTPAGSTSSAAA